MTTASTASHSSRIALAFAGIYLIWGTTYLAIALAIRTLPPFFSGGVRFLLAAGLMYAWLRWRTRAPLQSVDWKRAALCGVLLTGFGNGLVVWAQQGVPSGIAALLVAAIPVFVVAVEYLFFGGRLPGFRGALGIVLALSGVAIIVAHTHDLSGAARPIYVVAILLAVLSWSFGTLLQRTAVKPGQVLAFTCVQIFFGGVAQLVLATLNNEWRILSLPALSWQSLVALMYLVIFGSIVALNCYLWLLTQVAPQKVSTYALVNPVVALLLGAAVLGERITGLALLSTALVLLGIALILMPKEGIQALLQWRRLSRSRPSALRAE